MIELQHIGYEVEQDGEHKQILKDIDLTIDERFVAITGPNGGGKSTLAKVIAGILPPTTSALLHNASTLGISLKSMTDLLPEPEAAATVPERSGECPRSR